MAKNVLNNQKKTRSKSKKIIKKDRKNKLALDKVIVMLRCTYNNTIASVVDLYGNVIAWSSCGSLGYKGSKKSTPYVSTKVGEDVALKALKLGAKECDVVIRGVGIGRQAAIKGIHSTGLKINVLIDKTPIQHGGVKPRRKPSK
ncbi:MAG: 30S ribosomal protein S11 [Candidatus Dojkabacteria bacterium]|nr:30S ribosomal protein S11 [Candidatus Dojkabacteria bacterium]